MAKDYKLCGFLETAVSQILNSFNFEEIISVIVL